MESSSILRLVFLLGFMSGVVWSDDDDDYEVYVGEIDHHKLYHVADGAGKDALQLHKVTYDVATVNFVVNRTDDVIINAGHGLAVWLQTDLCIGCKLLRVIALKKNTKPKDSTALIDTRFATRIKVTTWDATYPQDNNTFCELYYLFGQFGEYNLTIPTRLAVKGFNVSQCGLDIIKNPTYANIVIIVLYASFFTLLIIYMSYPYCVKMRRGKSTLINHTSSDVSALSQAIQVPLVVPDPPNKPTGTAQRLKSIDAFRGIAIYNLVVGATGDGHYWFIQHARWYGITLADFFFPWFVFIMGTSIHLSFDKLLSKGKTYREIFKKLLIRSLTLFIMGICLQPKNDLRVLRIPGVLQRFGITYFVVASSYLLSRRLLGRRAAHEHEGGCAGAFRDIRQYLELPLAVCCIALNVCLTFFLPVPGCPLGYQGPGGPLVGENGELTNCTGGAAAYIDRSFFTGDHILHEPTSHAVYKTSNQNDPEGILGTFNSIALCVFGLQAGKILHLFDTTRGRVSRMVTWGLILIACSAVLSKCHMADGWIPIVKNLWSVSFIALTGGTAFLFQALLHILIDVTAIWDGAPMTYAGENSILLYTGAIILTPFLPFTWAPMVGNHTEYVLLGAWSGGVWLVIAYIAHRKKFFLRL